MASDALTILLVLVGVGIIAVGVMILTRPPVVVKEEVIRPRYRWNDRWDARMRPWYGYSHLPVRPVMFG